MSSIAAAPPVDVVRSRQRERTVARPLRWFAAGSALMFAVSFIGADVIEAHHDVYYLAYFTIALTFLASFVAHMGLDWRASLRANLGWSLAVGALMGAALIKNVLGDASTVHPSSAYYVFELAWRGVAYGAVDALVLFVFPAVVASMVVGDRHGMRRKIAFAALTFALSFGITATYHMGYGQFRGSDLAKPEVGALIANVPAALTGNPAGAVLAHSAFHLTANVHTYRSGIYLPPDLNGYADRGTGGTGLGLAALWIVVAGGAIWSQRERLFRRPDATIAREGAR
jgi:hypothetical protein